MHDLSWRTSTARVTARVTAPVLALVLAACGGSTPDSDPGDPASEPAAAAAEAVAVDSSVALTCVKQQEDMERASAFDSTAITLAGGVRASVCYSRPVMRGRRVYGELVPYDRLWRTGANEPTTVHVPFAADIGGVRVEPGHYALYTVPMADEPWAIVVNRSTTQWGHESAYTQQVEAQEVGRGLGEAEPLEAPVETFTIRWEQTGDRSGDLLLEWEQTRVRIPVEALR